MTEVKLFCKSSWIIFFFVAFQVFDINTARPTPQDCDDIDDEFVRAMCIMEEVGGVGLDAINDVLHLAVVDPLSQVPLIGAGVHSLDMAGQEVFDAGAEGLGEVFQGLVGQGMGFFAALQDAAS